ncbi:hypothetical protein Micbo1qcDRAFT_158275 [Microdochium bolleyi]|uniref:Uncharacterized protein n=1 Tax=Microdochium bolleyi TaxID=196109 RepID=A0A136JG13_9PEZI|nr:hypothetical protein Micbo1qcDRAFT_158275 [Microdochium bolleyi]
MPLVVALAEHLYCVILLLATRGVHGVKRNRYIIKPFITSLTHIDALLHVDLCHVVTP